MNYLKIFHLEFILFLFLLLITKINSASYADSLEIVANFTIINFKLKSGEIKNCSTCMPAGIKLSSNGTIFCSFPRWYDNVIATFGKYNPKENSFEPWPSLEENQKYKNKDSSGINSVLGFEIDSDDNLYILDQGKIDNKKAKSGSIKLIHYSLKTGKKIKDYVFKESIADLDNSFLNDIVIDTNKKRKFNE